MAHQCITNPAYSAVLMTVFSLLIISTLYVYYKKRQLHIELSAVTADFQSAILKTKFKTREDVYQEVAREIHDDIMLSLTLSKLNLATLRYGDELDSRRKITQAAEFITDAINKLNNLSKSLHSGLIDNNGLQHALENELTQIERSGYFKINYSLRGKVISMGREKELMIYRTIQESLHNIIKHSQASVITICMNYGLENLEINIADNGKGFDDESCREGSSGTGLLNIKHRLKLLDGSFSINSQKNIGTTISILIPIIPKQTKI